MSETEGLFLLFGTYTSYQAWLQQTPFTKAEMITKTALPIWHSFHSYLNSICPASQHIWLFSPHEDSVQLPQHQFLHTALNGPSSRFRPGLSTISTLPLPPIYLKLPTYTSWTTLIRLPTEISSATLVPI